MSLHPFREETKHTYPQICAKVRAFYGVPDAERWYRHRRKEILDGHATDCLGIGDFETLAEFWERKQMEQKWSGAAPSVGANGVGSPEQRGVVEIYTVRAPGAGGELGILTTTHDPEIFASALAAAAAKYLSQDGRSAAQLERDLHWIIRNALPIAFKLAGYKADQVVERHVLTCGSSAPSPDDILASA